MAIVTAQDVSRVFPMPAGPVTALRDVSMTIAANETKTLNACIRGPRAGPRTAPCNRTLAEIVVSHSRGAGPALSP